ncbi:glucose-6-phosphate 1-epimerase [Novimethylophilus kurashikiensis]|uniref:Putative glucose-6-phosphate 1-epimerase n=1 Tax=Novimethylophilus kurashikiensis TaxID=1825523 RepID=A0A2R5F818_9PROT|nr:D-hexose-6-phosphate mutarotase [Novimethylophilus kurashikiensis]GBG12821.1 glucose-6-phosphate 1-epimerase [Novimethylophilus kurashikiensis]
MSALNSLNHHFSIAGQLTFTATDDGQQIAEINNAHAKASIALQGAHVMTFQPHGEAPVLWMSENTHPAPGKAIRGGIPVCWPWFGDHPDKAFPQHGFARVQLWRVIGSEALADGSTRVVFELQKNEAARAQWPYSCHLRCTVTVGKTLTVELATENLGEEAFTIGEALHTYLAVSDIEHIRVSGVEEAPYWDKVRDLRSVQNGAITFSGEFDRLFMNTSNDCVIDDAQFKRRIRIKKSGSSSTIVWNPWAEKSEKMGDMGKDGYRTMVCVESGNAMDNIVTLAPGETHKMHAIYSVEPL